MQRHCPGLLALCDVVVAGPYVAHRPPTALAGSDNQTVHLLTPRARQLYDGWQQWPMHRVQLSVTPQAGHAHRMLMVGIPQRSVAPALAERLSNPHNAACPAAPDFVEIAK